MNEEKEYPVKDITQRISEGRNQKNSVFKSLSLCASAA